MRTFQRRHVNYFIIIFVFLFCLFVFLWIGTSNWIGLLYVIQYGINFTYMSGWPWPYISIRCCFSSTAVIVITHHFNFIFIGKNMDRNGSESRKCVESMKSFIDQATPRMPNADEYSFWIKLHIFAGRQTERRLRNACQQWYHRSGIIRNRYERGQWAVQSIFVSTKWIYGCAAAHARALEE